MPPDPASNLMPRGAHHRATVPDTLDLAHHAALAINGIGGCIDPELLTMWGLVQYGCKRPHLSHWASAETLCDPKFGESLPLLRVMSGSTQHLALEGQFREAMLARVQDGLYWDLRNPQRPWRNSYSAWCYGEGKDEDFCTVPGAARLLRAMLAWHELGWQPARMEETLRSLTAGLLRIAVKKDDYAYYPERGGWGEPCAYPRSGWLNTDEAKGETEGGEGSVTCMHGHQIYGAAHWYALSRDPAALELAARLTRYCMLPRFWGGVPDPDGERKGIPGHVAPCRPSPACTSGAELGHWFSHFHARAIALRGMLEYGRIAEDTRVLEFVRRAYEFTLSQGIPRMGWINCYPAALNHVEGCALGDLVALGMRLSDLGLGDYWDDVDAVTRNQLVEQQLTDPDALRAICDAGRRDGWEPDAKAFPGQLFFADDIVERTLGVYGGTAAPSAIPNLWVMHCCTGNATQGLYYAWEGAVREQGHLAEVNLLLNRAAKLVDVDSWLPYTGKVVIHNKLARRIAVRIPAWVRPQDLRLDVDGTRREAVWLGQRVLVDDLEPGAALTLTFPVRETTAAYTVNARTAAEAVYTCTFRGSTLVDIAPRTVGPKDYPLYRRQHLRRDTAPMKPVERYVPEHTVRAW